MPPEGDAVKPISDLTLNEIHEAGRLERFKPAEVFAEFSRRQAMLAAAGAMAGALQSYVEGIPRKDSESYDAYRDRRTAAVESLSAYAAAKGDRS